MDGMRDDTPLNLQVIVGLKLTVDAEGITVDARGATTPVTRWSWEYIDQSRRQATGQPASEGDGS